MIDLQSQKSLGAIHLTEEGIHANIQSYEISSRFDSN